MMNVKTNSKGYQKKIVKEHAKNRGNIYSMTTKVDDVDIFARVHINKLPIYLHTSESMLPGPERKSIFWCMVKNIKHPLQIQIGTTTHTFGVWRQLLGSGLV